MPAPFPALRRAGYEVAGAGKMHFIGLDQLHGLGRRLTKDIYPSDFSWAMGREKLGELMQHPPEGKWKDFGVTAGPCDWSPQLEYDAEVQFRTLEFLRAHRGEAPRPFCLFMSYSHPHPPYLAPQKYWDWYEDVEIDLPTIPENLDALRSPMDRWLHYFEGIPDEALREPDILRRLRRAYYAMVSYVDAQVGELFDTLDDMGMREQTAVLFMADHGDQLGERMLLEKLNFYEASARIPLIGRFPGHWPGGGVHGEPVSLIDIFPTLCEIAGAPVPPGVEGRSFCDLLEGRPSTSPERLAILRESRRLRTGVVFHGTQGGVQIHLPPRTWPTALRLAYRPAGRAQSGRAARACGYRSGVAPGVSVTLRLRYDRRGGATRPAGADLPARGNATRQPYELELSAVLRSEHGMVAVTAPHE